MFCSFDDGSELPRLSHQIYYNVSRNMTFIVRGSQNLKLGKVWVFVRLIHRPTRKKNQLYKHPNVT